MPIGLESLAGQPPSVGGVEPDGPVDPRDTHSIMVVVAFVQLLAVGVEDAVHASTSLR
jgi:hypothetical protein